MRNGIDLAEQAAAFDRDALQHRLAEAEADRKRVRQAFPLEEWDSLPLERYAQGIAGSTPTFCRLLEHGTDALGSIRGGSAAKLIIYRHNSGQWRMSGGLKDLDPQAAWERVRSDFLASFRAAQEERFDDLDELWTLIFGQALVTKTLAAYYPERFLPVYSNDHIRHFAEVLGADPYRTYGGIRTWRANLRLRQMTEEREEFRGWDPLEVVHFLYHHFDPRSHKRKIWKIAPGKQGALWDECRSGSYICVAWDELGDLGQYESDTDLKLALTTLWPGSEGNHLRLARQLLEYRELESGDVIVANRGKSEVLAIGTVSDGYHYDAARTDFRHLVPVDWDEGYAQRLEEPENSWQTTFATVRPSLLHRLTAGRGRGGPARGAGTHTSSLFVQATELPPEVERVLQALQAKGQVILQGPPGTGKTRLALSAALALVGRGEVIDASPGEREEAVRQLLSGTGPGPGDGQRLPAPRVRMVTFHPSYGYEDFVEGYKPDPAAVGDGLRLSLTDGLFHEFCSTAARHPEEPFLLIIDEINRGDLPRIFGELITLLEQDKRGLPVILPTSSRTFTVPRNVRIIGTMNTVDRSVGHLDSALGRRFARLELAPDPDAVPGSVGALDLGGFLRALNRRITRVLGADHQIGHSFLLHGDRPLTGEEQLAAAFYHDIVPVLTDYGLGRAEALQRLLGKLVDDDTGAPVTMPPQDLAAALAAEFTAAGDEAGDVSGTADG